MKVTNSMDQNADHTANLQDESLDRRQTIRRAEDYFWLQRLSSVTGDFGLVINRQMELEFVDEKLYDLIEIASEKRASIQTFNDLAVNLAETGFFGPGDPASFVAFISDLMTNQRLNQSDTPHLLSAVTPSGRHVVVKITYGRDDRYILLFSDETESWIDNDALDLALDIGGSGYWHFNVETSQYRMRGNFLQGIIDPETYARIDSEGPLIIVHPDDRELATSHMLKCINERTQQTVTTRIVDKDGQSHWLRNYLKPKCDENGDIRRVVCFFTNVTTQLRTQDDLKKAQEQAETALKAKNSFLSRLAHEVRTPMNAVIGLADAIIHHHKNPELQPKLTLIQESAEKIVRLVDETLQHAKLEEAQIELNPREASPSKLVRTVCSLWEDKAEKSGTKLTYSIAPDVPKTILFDDFRYEQCLNNLISNAVKFTENGRIQVLLTVAGNEKARQLVLAVRDTGIGMTPEQQSRIFMPFRQADSTISSRYGGTGLGMSITKDLIELMSGRVSVKSEPGKGTLFVMTIPIRTPDSDAVGTDTLVGSILNDAASETESDYSDLSVLIVDDNATNHLVMSSLLDSVVGHIDTALNGEEAIEALKRRQYDVVLMDIHMPVMDGIEATLAIRSTKSDYMDVPIIALTADPQYQQSRLCRNIGMDEALAKPVRLASLLETFDEVLKNAPDRQVDAKKMRAAALNAA